MQQFYYLKIVIIGFAIALLVSGCKKRLHKKELSESLKQNIEYLNKDSATIAGETIYHPDIIARLYKDNQRFVTVKWNNLDNVNQLLNFIRHSNDEGLNPEDYHFSLIEELKNRIQQSPKASVEDVTQLEFLLSDAFLLMASHLAEGKTDQQTADPQWHAAKRNLNIDWPGFIDSVLQTRKITEALNHLSPNHREYNNLKKALARYKKIERWGGWSPFKTNFKKLEKGMMHSDVALLRKRLSIEQGFIKPDTDDENLFDQTLHQQAIIFQRRNSLIGDGIIGGQSVEVLNVSVSERISTIEANLERWRWLNDNLGETYILVNIANYSLQLVKNGKTIFTSDAIVGRPLRETPVFSSLMTYLVFNPTWTLPPTILNEDVIPEMIKNPNYLYEKQMKVLTMSGTEVDPSTINWNNAAKTGFPYMIRQIPGSTNPLGRIKFMFPNHHNIYIHDTPSRSSFSRNDRNQSSGCIRINKPFELAQLVLENNPGWTQERLQEILDDGEPKTVLLLKPIPVHVIYITAWADEKGITSFGRDVYKRDAALIKALREQHSNSKGE